MKRLLLAALIASGCLLPAASAGADVGFNVTELEPVGAHVRDVAVGDLDGRNGPDIVTAYSEGGLSVQLNDGHGGFGPPHSYSTGCDTVQVELADLGGTDNDNVPDGKLDAVVVCLYNSGDQQYLARMAGDGSGGFGPIDQPPGLSFGPFNLGQPQEVALADLRGPGLPPVPVFSYTSVDPYHEPYAFREFCFTYDWVNRECLGRGEPAISPPLVPGAVAQARVFTVGGEKGILDWGPLEGHWQWSTRELAPNLPTTATDFRSLTIGDLAGDGPDIISASGSCGCGYQDGPPAGVVDVLYGNNAVGVPDQVGTKFSSAPGVTSIATADFDLDGKTDLIGNSWSYDPGSKVITGGVFVQPGNGAGALGAPQMIPLSHNEVFSRAPVRVADLDGNGTPDAVAIVGGKVQVLLNQTVPPPPAPPTGGGIVNALKGVTGLPKTVIVDKKGFLLLGTAANPPTASVDLTITLPSGKGGKARIAAAKPKGAKPTVIGHAKITISSGAKRALKVKLKPAALALLRKGPLRATLAVLAVGTDGSKSKKTQPLKIKAAKHKKRH